MDPSNPPPVLVLADGNGRNAAPYTSNAQLALYGWSSDGQHFLYAGSANIGIGQVDVPPVKVVMEGGTAVMQWLNPATFITAANVSGSWQFTSTDLDGETEVLGTAVTTPPQFDVWSP
jgi:hypothetical protein